MKKGLITTNHKAKEDGVCGVALSCHNTLSPLQVCLASLVSQLKKEDPEAKVNDIFITDKRWIKILLSQEKTAAGFVGTNIQQQGDDVIECLIAEDINVSGAIAMLSALSHKLFLLQYKHKREDIEEMNIKGGKWTIRTKSVGTQSQPAAASDSARTNVVPMQQEMLMLIDGSNLLSRAFFATSHGGPERLMRTSDGRYTNAVYGMIQSFFGLLKRYKPTHVAIMWDVSRSSSHRREVYADYKGTRGETDPALKEQFETAREVFEMMCAPQFTVPTMEADDLIGTAAVRWARDKGLPCYIVSNDKDLHQLIDAQTSQLMYRKGGEVLYTEADFEAEYGIKTSQWVDAKALLGDTSDNIPGVSGVGDKAVFPMLQQFGSVEGIYQDLSALEPNFKRYIKKLEAGKENAFLSKQLATIVTDAKGLTDDWEQFRIQMSKKGMLEAFRKLEFDSLLERIS